MSDVTNCFPGPCTCCTCRGVMCMFYHPGHDHRVIDMYHQLQITREDGCHCSCGWVGDMIDWEGHLRDDEERITMEERGNNG